MVPFKGRSSMKQYLPLKPVKCGFKVWAMANASNGYLYDFSVYTGTTGGGETALGEKVVLMLSEPLKGKHHQLFFDNYFTSITLPDKLLAQGTYGCGTIWTNVIGYEKRDLIMQNAISYCFSSCHHFKASRAPSFPLGL